MVLFFHNKPPCFAGINGYLLYLLYVKTIDFTMFFRFVRRQESTGSVVLMSFYKEGHKEVCAMRGGSAYGEYFAIRCIRFYW